MASARWHTLAMGIVSFIIFDEILSSPCPGILVEKNNNNICTTDECIQMARKIHQNMRSDIDPCEDFYKFACGGFREKIEEVDQGIFDEVKQITENQLKSILIDGCNSDFPPLRMAYDYYQSCIADETAKKDGVRPIYEQVGKWPLTEVDKNTSWLEVMRKSRNLGFLPNYIITPVVLKNPYNKSEKFIAIMPPTSFPISTPILQQGLHHPLTKKYFDRMILTGEEFEALTSKDNLKFTITNTSKEIEKLFDFEVQLAKITATPLIPVDLFSLEIGTLKQVKEQYPFIKLTPVLEAVIGIGVKLNDAEKAAIAAPKFMVELELLLKTTPERVIVNYFIWRNIYSSLGLTFAIEEEPRFSDVFDAQYVRKYFNDDSRKGVQELVHQIYGEVKKSLLHLSWMDNKTKEYATEKLEAITNFVGYVDGLLNRDTEMKKLYGSVHFDINNHYESSLNLLKLLNDQLYSILYQPSQYGESRVFMRPVKINAGYAPSENAITLAAAILQNPFYSVNRPNYLNFGVIGSIIGHELLHAFDNRGCHYDKYGQIKDWWQPQTKKKYKDRTKCFVDQYGSYYLEEIKEYVNGSLTLGENMADNEGIKNAYQAYKSWQSSHKKEERLPGLDYTPEQMFWISSANTWCSKYAPSSLKLQVQIDTHAPSMLRVNGVLSNQKEFAKDFSCPINSKMNPPKKCQFL